MTTLRRLVDRAVAVPDSDLDLSEVPPEDEDGPLPADGGTFARLVREQTARTRRLADWRNPPPLGPYHAQLEVCAHDAVHPFDREAEAKR